MDDLRSADTPRRRGAASALGAITREDIPKLIPHLLDPDPRARFHVQRALITLDVAAVEALSTAANCDNLTTRYHAIITLARVQDDSAAEELRLLATHSDFQTRNLALWGLLWRAYPGLPDLLERLLELEDVGVWHTAVQYILRIDLLKGLRVLLTEAASTSKPKNVLAADILFKNSSDVDWPHQIILSCGASVEERNATLEALYNAPVSIAKSLCYDNILMRDLHSHLLGGRPFRTFKEILRDLQRDEDEKVRIAAEELVAWRELPRPSHGKGHSGDLVRGVDGAAEANTLLRGSDEEIPARRSLWERLRAGIGL